MSRLGPRGRPLVRHLIGRGLKAAPQEYARLGDKEALAALVETQRQRRAVGCRNDGCR